MSVTTTENKFCKKCGEETTHIVVLVRNQSPYEGDANRNRKEFLSGFLKGSVAGAFCASMDEFSRHVICEKCGEKTIEA
ncbi:hypothetical protein VA7868_00382 [Vibrio aerogenes CECT 7868]|uniref:Uncharacterized protein n=1 Tax=Vibrio aerogenes CECT 7868 TaxID=1216006 RepID=A0A1M5VGI5_9VIBR|nr:hypothetical protein [Vibrio aerogenes]SHH74311.1 hypothetical protein VA7868_00382 [Vibrio aerogenes CECT 7868]